MAARYWVRNAVGNWNSTANWSSSSLATVGGASVPGTADTVFFSANSQNGQCTINVSPTVVSVNMTGFTGTIIFNGSGYITITGTGTPYIQPFSANFIRTGSSITNTNIYFAGTTSATKTLNIANSNSAGALNYVINASGTYAFTDYARVKNLYAYTPITINTHLNVNGYLYCLSPISSGFIYHTNLNSQIAASSMVSGTQYVIITTGTTNFTSYGSTSNTLNTAFIANGPGTGTGTVIEPIFLGALTSNSGSSFSYYINDTSYTTNPIILASNITFLGTSSFNVYGGFFTNRDAYGSVASLSFQGGSSYFNYDFSSTAYMNIKIYNTGNPNGYELSIYGSNNFRGCSPSASVVADFSSARIEIAYGGSGGTTTVNIPNGTVIGELKGNFLSSNINTLAVTGTNISFYKLNLAWLVANSNIQTIVFDSGATIKVGEIDNSLYGPAVNSVITSSGGSGAPFTLNKLGGGCGYFAGKTIKNCTGTPTNAWCANTDTVTYNAGYFGRNVNGGGNSGIVFNQFPALGGFNEFF
jgi:hypothetical protein